jgi:hypothetical protein
MDIFLWIIPKPPDWAIEIATLYSVTVSIADEINGIASLIFLVILVNVVASLGKTEDWAGLIRTSSNESAV